VVVKRGSVPAAPHSIQHYAQGSIDHLAIPVAVGFFGGEPAAQLNLTAIQQTSNSQRRCLLCAVKAILLKGEPGELGVGDHPTGERPDEQLADRHGFCNGTLRVCLIWVAAVAPSAPQAFAWQSPRPGRRKPLLAPPDCWRASRFFTNVGRIFSLPFSP